MWKTGASAAAVQKRRVEKKVENFSVMNRHHRIVFYEPLSTAFFHPFGRICGKTDHLVLRELMLEVMSRMMPGISGSERRRSSTLRMEVRTVA